MKPAGLTRLASAVYGSDWQTRLAEDADVNPRTVRRWAAGNSPVPEDIEPLLRQIAQRRMLQLAEAAGLADNL